MNASHVAIENSKVNSDFDPLNLRRSDDSLAIVSNFNITGNANPEIMHQYSLSLNSSVKETAAEYIKNMLLIINDHMNDAYSETSKKLELTESDVEKSQNAQSEDQQQSVRDDNKSESEYKRSVKFGNVSDSDSAEIDDFDSKVVGSKLFAQV